MDKQYSFNDLVDIMALLRSENGCPWDKEQTIDSLKKYLLEESYEVLDAIDDGDKHKHYEELGDLLLQIVFQSQVAKDESLFTINDVINSICQKLIVRHPHIFGKEKVSSSSEVLKKWEEIKAEEKGIESYTQAMNQIPKNMPALLRSYKVQKKAKEVGFDWDNVEPAFEKVYEETLEVKEAHKANDKNKISEEIGDLLFSVVNVSRMLDVEPETALSQTTKKFINRFEYVEKTSKAQGKELKNMSLEEMDELWNQAKGILKDQI